eukprot:5152389-Prymnesium_polylepis.1
MTRELRTVSTIVREEEEEEESGGPTAPPASEEEEPAPSTGAGVAAAPELDFSLGPPDYSQMDRMKKLAVMAEYRRWKSEQEEDAVAIEDVPAQRKPLRPDNRVAPMQAHP